MRRRGPSTVVVVAASSRALGALRAPSARAMPGAKTVERSRSAVEHSRLIVQQTREIIARSRGRAEIAEHALRTSRSGNAP